MLARPEPGSKEHVLLWLASKPQDETYVWASPGRCACGQYELEAWGVRLADRQAGTTGHPLLWGPRFRTKESPTPLNTLAYECESRTFGELYKRAQMEWA